ncbi:MAG: DUF4365 domain-containing protein [Mogibacterium sp.]|nr:DUF4365 domain-containing protein [Mogibacterium sp.]
MSTRMSIDSEQRKIGSRACAIVHYQIDAERWLYREDPDPAVGRDCVIELSENDRWLGHRLECQIKGTKNPSKLTREDAFTYSLETRTIQYALNSSGAFVLFYVDVVNEIVYYLPVQDYFIENKQLFDKLDAQQETINVHIPQANILAKGDRELREIARSTYVDGPGPDLKRYLQMRLF